MSGHSAVVQAALAADPYYQKLLGVMGELERLSGKLARLEYKQAHQEMRRRLQFSVCPWQRFSWAPKTAPRLAAMTGRRP